MPRPDRVLGGVALGLATATTVVALAGAARPALPAPTDLAVLADLLTRVARAEAAEVAAEYDVERHAASPGFAGAVTVVQRDRLRITSGGGTLTVRLPGGTVRCTETDDGPQCLAAPDDAGDLPAVAVLAELVRSGRYVLDGETGEASEAGERARCFHLDHRRGVPVPALGRGATLCLAEDGVVVRSRVEQVGATDERTLVRLDRTVDDRVIDALLAPFDPQLDGER
jgi:hypothetical protein